MGSIIGQEGGWASPDRDEVIHLDVCGASASAVVTANISARRLKRSVKRRM